MNNNLGYSQALFDLALEHKKLDEFKNNSLDLLEILTQNPHFLKTLSSRQVLKEEKKKFLDKIFANKVEPLLLVGLKVMIDHNKFYSLEKTLSELNSLINKKLNLKEGIVYSAKALKNEDIKNITKKLEKKFNSKIELKNLVDKKLIDGIKVIIDNNVIDNSILLKLQKLKEEIIEG